MSSEFEQYVLDLYEKWLEDHPGQGVYNLKDAYPDVADAVHRAMADGGLAPDIEAAIWNALREADKRLTDRGRRLLKREFAQGQDSLDNGEWLNALVPLGGNNRVQFGDMGYDEYTLANDLRYENVRAVQDEYNVWRDRTAPYVPLMRSGLTVRQIIEQGLVTDTGR